MIMKHSSRLCACLAATLLAVTPLAAVAKQSAKNDQILKATDPFEGLAEAGIAGTAGPIAKSFKAAQKGREAARALLSAEAAQRFDEVFKQMMAAESGHDNVALSLAAAEGYKVLVSSLDPATLTIPMEVSLLDYCGFRTHALLKAKAPDWKAIAATAQEANADWAKIRDRVDNAKLRDGMDQAQRGMATAGEKQDAALSHSAAKANLDLVDELESYFDKK